MGGKKPHPAGRVKALPATVGAGLLFLCGSLFLTACGHPQRKVEVRATPHYFDQAGEAVSETRVVRAAAERRFVLVGEGHDRSCDHHAQASLLAALGGGVIVGLEMVSVDEQEVLDRFNQRALDADGAASELAWEQRWGFPFSLYRPIFEVAWRERLPVVALNLPQSLVRAAARQGLEGLSAEERARLPRIIPPPPEQEEALRVVWEAHAAHTGGRGFDRFVLVQSLWDSQMAAEALRWSEELDRPIVILAGAAHVARGWGIAHRLEVLQPGSDPLLIVPWRGEAAVDPREGDYFFLCP